MRIERWHDEVSGLRAVAVIHDATLGPAAGGVRTAPQLSEAQAVAVCRRLAESMTIKCAAAGLDAGGGKIVVWELGADRGAAFEALGRFVAGLDGELLTAGDLGTTDADLGAMARTTSHVHMGGARLAEAAGRGLLRCVEAAAAQRGRSVASLTIVVQGAGTIGGAAARALAAAGARLRIADVRPSRAAALADAVGGRVVPAEGALLDEADVVCPCAVGDTVTEAIANDLRAWAVVGGANHVVASPAAERRLLERGILHVPDGLASAGAVIEGVGESVMGLDAAGRLRIVDRLGSTATEILTASSTSGRLPGELVREHALRRLRGDAAGPFEL